MSPIGATGRGISGAAGRVIDTGQTVLDDFERADVTTGYVGETADFGNETTNPLRGSTSALTTGTFGFMHDPDISVVDGYEYRGLARFDGANDSRIAFKTDPSSTSSYPPCYFIELESGDTLKLRKIDSVETFYTISSEAVGTDIVGTSTYQLGLRCFSDQSMTPVVYDNSGATIHAGANVTDNTGTPYLSSGGMGMSARGTTGLLYDEFTQRPL